MIELIGWAWDIWYCWFKSWNLSTYPVVCYSQIHNFDDIANQLNVVDTILMDHSVQVKECLFQINLTILLCTASCCHNCWLGVFILILGIRIMQGIAHSCRGSTIRMWWIQMIYSRMRIRNEPLWVLMFAADLRLKLHRVGYVGCMLLPSVRMFWASISKTLHPFMLQMRDTVGRETLCFCAFTVISSKHSYLKCVFRLFLHESVPLPFISTRRAR